MNKHKLKQFSMILLLILLLSIIGISVGHADDGENEDPETTEIVVKLDLASTATIDDINNDFGTTTIEQLLASAGIYRLHVAANSQASNVAEQMRADIRIIYAEPNFVSEAPEGDGRSIKAWGGEDPVPFGEQYALDLLGLSVAHTFNRGTGVTVAVLDTGVQLEHPDLSDSLTDARYDFIDDDATPTETQNNQDDDGDGLTDEAYGHGTHVAGIVHLVAPDAQIMPLRVLDDEGRGNMFVIVEAILYAAEHGADIINLSLGTAHKSEFVEDILKQVAQQYDIVIIAAAGNLNNRVEQFPASESRVLAVTSTGQTDQKSDFANFGEWVDITAPGESIYSTYPSNGYAWWSGTSMAVPFVTGEAALIRAAVPDMSSEEIAHHIANTAYAIDSLNPDYVDELGNGRADIAASLQALCNADGTCQVPDGGDGPTVEIYGIITSRPASSNMGTWVVGNSSYVADANTEIEQEHGTLAIGDCVEVKYRIFTRPFEAAKIETKDQADCQQIVTPTATPTELPTPVGTSPSATLTPQPVGNQARLYFPLLLH